MWFLEGLCVCCLETFHVTPTCALNQSSSLSTVGHSVWQLSSECKREVSSDYARVCFGIAHGGDERGSLG